MAFPTNADADPDPTTQIPWPSKNRKQVRMQSPDAPPQADTPSTNGAGQSKPPKKSGGKDADPSRRRMSTLDLINLSISMAGAQVAWTVELGYAVDLFLAFVSPSLSVGIFC